MEDETKDQGKRTESTTWRVPEGAPVRLDAFVRLSLPHLSARRIKVLIEEKSCLINGREAKKGSMLFPGDSVVFCGDPRYLAQAPISFDGQVPILFEDNALLAVDKPSGLATHGHSGKDDATLANYLLGMRPALLGVGHSRWEPGLLHRLDRDTSGVVLVAKQQKVFEVVRRQFVARTVGKFYRAIVQGKMPARGSVDYSLAHDPVDRRKMCHLPSAGGASGKNWTALTHFRTLGWGPGYSHVEIRIETGVTHQIRVHLRAIGHPIVGDPLYGDPGAAEPRCLLHASRLELAHPVESQRLRIESSLPLEFNGFETGPGP